MSLKAKLEAVIYAAEEPVTLAQLTAMFADEALEWNAERKAAAETEMAEAEGSPLLNDAFPHLELEQVRESDATASSAESAAEESIDVAGQEARTTAGEDAGGTFEDVAAAALETSPVTGMEVPSLETGVAAGGEVAADAANEASATSQTDEVERAKQQAKQREREARAAIKQILGELIAEYAADTRGIEIREIAGGYRMATKPEFHDEVRAFVKSQKPPLKLSLPALETLAVIAYKQPVTAPEVNEIRGVDSSAVFGSLLARKLITTAGRKPVVGRPILYKTTREFLLRFGLKDVSELPSMEEFEKMAASELEADVALEEAAAPEAEEFNPDLSVEMAEAEAVALEKAGCAEFESNPTSSIDHGLRPHEEAPLGNIRPGGTDENSPG